MDSKNKPINIRLKFESGQHQDCEFDSTSTVSDLIETATAIIASTTPDGQLDPTQRLQILGPPPRPKPIDLNNETALLSSLQLHRSQITISLVSDCEPTIRSSGAGILPAGSSSTAAPTPAIVPAPKPTRSTPGSNITGFSFTSGTRSSDDYDAPLSLSRKAPNLNDSPEVVLPGRGKVLLRVMPDDNSCLFRAISYVVTLGLCPVEDLRQAVVDAIRGDTIRYNEAVLEKSVDDYCRWIKTETSWGGGIELGILSNHFGVEIVAIDVQSLAVLRFNEGCGTRAFVVYSGIHYDALVLNPTSSGDPGEDIKQFDLSDKAILTAAVELCKKLQDRNYYTDTKRFSLRCGDCGKAIKGQEQATEHAKQTGHTNFTQN
ncbi:hypothetical protein BZA77DRAFT_34629 [Pyronema omphalodes]|nr:hypothetical protein BZA77DRAFT_34629 [Pyronema omphalodes]